MSLDSAKSIEECGVTQATEAVAVFKRPAMARIYFDTIVDSDKPSGLNKELNGTSITVRTNDGSLLIERCEQVTAFFLQSPLVQEAMFYREN